MFFIINEASVEKQLASYNDYYDIVTLMDSMFDILAELPLFKGIGRERMEAIVGKSKFHFLKYTPDEVIFRAGDRCDDIAFLISGTVRLTIENPDGRFSVSQSLKAQDVISPDFLFGKITRYPATVTSVDTVGLLLISKADYVKILVNDNVSLFNYLNLLSMNAQKAVEGILAISTGSVADRIAFWISALTQPRSFDIKMECRQRDLVALFGVPRTVLREELEGMARRGLIKYSLYGITVLDRKKLLDLLHNHAE